MSKDDGLKKNWYIIVALVIWVIARRNSLPITLDNKADYVAGCILFFFILGKWILQEGMYQTPQFICAGTHGSISTPPRAVGLWYIFRLGGIQHFGLHFKGDRETVIVPKSTCQKLHNNWYSIARTEFKPVGDVPHETSETILTEGFPTETVSVGYMDVGFEAKNPDFLKKEEYITKMDQVIVNLKRALKGEMVIGEEQKKHYDRTFGKKKGFFKKEPTPTPTPEND